MADVTCIDGTTLGVLPVPVVDRHDVAYEVTLRLTRDGVDFGAVGERCGYFLAAAAARLAEALADESPVASHWPDPADRFPASSLEGGLRAWLADEGLDADATWLRMQRYLPRDRDLFSFHTRDPDDLASAGELRCSLMTERTWVAGEALAGGGGRWRLAQRALLDAWGDGGAGARAILPATALADFLRGFLAEAAALGCRYDAVQPTGLLRRPAG
jgi:hypothetical protein